MEKELKKRLAVALISILAILAVFMGPAIIRPTDEEVIHEFAKQYFEAKPEDYADLFPNSKYRKEDAKPYIEERLQDLVPQGVLDRIIEEEGMVSHIKRSYIRKEILSLKHLKVSLISHNNWSTTYGIDGIVMAENVEDAYKERLEIKGQIVIIKEDGIPKIDQLYMIQDEARYFRSIWD